MKAYQRTLEGGIKVATGNAIRDQLAAIMQSEPETIDDEDLLVCRWIEIHREILIDVAPHVLYSIVKTIRSLNFRERRRELKKLYPYSDEEEARRQKRGRGGPPG